jgi:hypothetical protein
MTARESAPEALIPEAKFVIATRIRWPF